MLRTRLTIRLIFALLAASPVAGQDLAKPSNSVRFATFNASLNRSARGELARDLATPDDRQIRNVAEIIQRVRPDVLLINEFDFDADDASGGSVGAKRFLVNYLRHGQNGAEAIDYPHVFVPKVNTGIATGVDLDKDGRAVTDPGSRGYGNDAQGFGQFPGQYGFVIYSKFPFESSFGDFQTLLWKNVPGALLPTKPDGTPWYSPAALDVLRLSSKNHCDVAVRVGDKLIHILASHPTPPAFDGPEDRNGRRNFDEIRLWADYLTGGAKAEYLAPFVKLPPGTRVAGPETFVLMGDMNADPADGGSVVGAIQQLLDHPKIQAPPAPRSDGAAEASRLQQGANARHKGDPAVDTADFNDDSVGNLRADYVLPSRNLKVLGTGTFWPTASDPLARLVVMTPKVASSDHRLVYLDVAIP
ncbi:MAG: endonuclease/exonuclease/phosphatase family protein [Isosphaeraceae bacterium]|nr:endonuclease/exonuclease/phosphatase family protein [Isosphaeraceae bacterium]